MFTDNIDAITSHTVLIQKANVYTTPFLSQCFFITITYNTKIIVLVILMKNICRHIRPTVYNTNNKRLVPNRRAANKRESDTTHFIDGFKDFAFFIQTFRNTSLMSLTKTLTVKNTSSAIKGNIIIVLHMDYESLHFHGVLTHILHVSITVIIISLIVIKKYLIFFF